MRILGRGSGEQTNIAASRRQERELTEKRLRSIRFLHFDMVHGNNTAFAVKVKTVRRGISFMSHGDCSSILVAIQGIGLGVLGL